MIKKWFGPVKPFLFCLALGLDSFQSYCSVPESIAWNIRTVCGAMTSWWQEQLREEHSGYSQYSSSSRGALGENGYIEPFNGRLRDELLNWELFRPLTEAQIFVEEWRKEYNQV